MVQLLKMPKSLVLVGILTLILFVVSLYPLFSQLIFTYDQARDGYESYEIWHDRNPKIIGPSSDIPGVFHGPLWFYLLAVPYSMSNNNPYVAGVLFYVLQFLTVPVVGYVTYRIFGSVRVATLATLLYAFSPLFLASTRWLSNPIIAILIMPPLMFFLWRFVQGEKGKTPFIVGLLLGILVQADLAYILFLISIPFHILYFRFRPTLISYVWVILGFFLGVLTYVIAELKFSGQGIRAAIAFLQEPHSTHGVFSLFSFFFSKVEHLLSVTVLPLPSIVLWATVVGICLLGGKKLKEKKDQVVFLVLWISGLFVVTIFSTGIANSAFIFFPLLLPVVLLFSYVVSVAFSTPLKIALFSLLVIILQLSTSYKWINDKFLPFPAQQRTFYSDATKVIDYTYQSAGGKSFGINTVTVPLRYNATWSFLYEFYGKDTYGYVPRWAGPTGVGYLRSLAQDGELPSKRFFIVDGARVILQPGSYACCFHLQ